jgi:hypothetical protein
MASTGNFAPALYWTLMMSFPILGIVTKNSVQRIAIIMALYPFVLYRFKNSSFAVIDQNLLLFAVFITCGLSLIMNAASKNVYRKAIESKEEKTTKNTYGVYFGALGTFLFVFLVYSIFKNYRPGGSSNNMRIPPVNS